MKEEARAAAPEPAVEIDLLRALSGLSRDVGFRYRAAPAPGFTYVSPSVTAVSGYTPAALCADPDLAVRLVHPEDRNLVEAVLAGRQAPPEPFRVRWQRKDGQVIWIELRTTPFSLPDGTVGVDGVARVITREIGLEAEVREAEQRFRAVFDHAPVAIAIVRRDRIVDANAAFLTMFGLADRADAVGRPLSERIPSFSHATGRGHAARRSDHGPIPTLGESTGLRADGRELPIRIVRERIVLPEGPATLVEVRDLADERAAPARLEDALGRLGAIVAASPLPIFTIDSEGRIKSWNAAAERVFGWSADEVLGRPNPTVPPELEDEYRANIAAVLDGGQLAGSFRRRRRDGSPIEIALWTAALRSGGHAPIEILSIAEDVTERSRAERALRASEERFRSLLDASPAAVVLVDRAGRIVLASPRVREFFGYAPTELEGQEVGVLIPDGARAQHAAQLTDFVDHSGVRPLGHGRHLSARRRDGTTFPAEIALTSMRGAEGELYGMATIVDITHREQLEAQLRRAQRFESIGQLAGGIAHDFNNLVTAINGYTELAAGELDDPDRLRADLAQIREAGDRAARLTWQLLAFARRQVLEPVALNLNEVVMELRPILIRLLREDIELTMALDPALGTVMADRSQLEQVIVNLVVNARDAMPDGGRLLIETANVDLDTAYAATHHSATPGAYIQLVISDTGIGMDADTLSRVFEPFFTTKGPDQGSGLGLATVYGIVKQSGGNIWPYSEPGAGSAFKIYLPRSEAVAQASPNQTDAEGTFAGSETVLLVEDDVAVRSFARSILERHGYRVLEAADAREALGIASGEVGSIDLLITDVIMPRMHGTELAAQLREVHPTLPVLYTSGYTEGGAFQERRGDDSTFLSKPFSGTMLVHKVREALGG